MNKVALTYISALVGLLCKMRLNMYIILYYTCILYVLCMHKRKIGPGSSVGIATGYGLDGPGIESRCR
jgi:hypothetical protein